MSQASVEEGKSDLQSPYSRALRGASLGLWEWSSDGELWYSSHFLQMLGANGTGTGYAEFPFSELLHPLDKGLVEEAANRCRETGLPFDQQFRLRVSYGEYRWFRARGEVYKSPYTGLWSIAGGIKDITEFKLTSEVIRQREKVFLRRQRSQAIDCLAAGIAHEFNNLLQAVHGYTSFAMRNLPPDSEPYQDLVQALSATDKAADITRQLLEFSSAEEQAPHSVDVRAAAEVLIELVKPLKTDYVDLRVDICSESLVAHGDETALRQALLNLCINARDAMPDGGRLLLKVEPFEVVEEHSGLLGELTPGGHVRISVTDEGTGIPKEDFEKVFEPFYSTKEIGQGTGLGLSTTRGVIDSMRGYLDLNSELGAGTTFSVYLPAEGYPEKGPSCPLTQSLKPLRVLYLEGSTLEREAGRRLLTLLNVNAYCVGDAKSALEILEAHQSEIDLVMINTQFDHAHDSHDMEKLLVRSGSLPMIKISGLAHELDGDEEVNWSGALQKPFCLSSLSAAMTNGLRSHTSASADLNTI